MHAAIRANPGGEKKEKAAYTGEKQPKRKARKLTYDERKRNVKVRPWLHICWHLSQDGRACLQHACLQV